MDRDGEWTSRHQMSVNGKRDGISRQDMLAVSAEMNFKQGREIIDVVVASVADWLRYARDAGIEPARIESIGRTHRLL